MKTPRTQIEGCTCGRCYAEADENGNDDYGMTWSAERETYTPRNCPTARYAAKLGKSLRAAVAEGHLNRSQS